jgi:hypothetical protein
MVWANCAEAEATGVEAVMGTRGWRKSWERTGAINLGLYHGSDGESYASGTSYGRDNSRNACNDARVDTGEDLQAMAYVRL